MAAAPQTPAMLDNQDEVFKPFNGRAALGGVCCMRYMVGADGAPLKIAAENCPDRQMAHAATKMISTWTYRPAQSTGAAVHSGGHKAVVKFYPLSVGGSGSQSVRMWQRRAAGASEYEQLCQFSS